MRPTKSFAMLISRVASSPDALADAGVRSSFDASICTSISMNLNCVTWCFVSGFLKTVHSSHHCFDFAPGSSHVRSSTRRRRALVLELHHLLEAAADVADRVRAGPDVLEEDEARVEPRFPILSRSW
jgi:hypothetical protein